MKRDLTILDRCSDFVLTEDYYTNISEFIARISEFEFPRSYQRKKKNGYYVYNAPCAFDIETSSFYNGKNKAVCMYVWQFCINGIVCVGRTWEQFIRLLEELQRVFSLSQNNRLYVYVHNLSYEFQFIRKRLTWDSVFSVDIRKPVKALCSFGIEFRDSYILSGYSLDMTAKQLQHYKVRKQTGLLNYDEIRTSETPLTHDEILYCIYDVIVVSAYIREQIEQYGTIVKIPLTNTGRVRDFCRKNCFYGFSEDETIRKQTKYNYNALMNILTLTKNEYIIWKQSFQGGFTHANAVHVGDLYRDVTSYDFTSSYPYVMLSEKFPMGRGFRKDITTLEEFNKFKKLFFMVFYVRFTGVSPKIFADNPISRSRCIECENPVLNNGRVVYADRLTIACNDVDLDVYLKFYNVEHMEISGCYCYARDYLPKNFILSILKLYNNKTSLKGVKGKEREYLHSKGMLNSCYGMSVTDIVRDNIDYIDEWETTPADVDDLIEKYNKNRSRFLFYPWGCAVTSFARRNLFSAIAECQNDYIYSDTDSVKIMNAESHKEYFKQYNKMVEQKLQAVADHYNIPIELFKPKTIKGVEKLIGVWDCEGTYAAFKTLGAKRYIYFQDHGLHTTIAGVSKNGVVKYLTSEYRQYRHKALHGKKVTEEDYIKYVADRFNNELTIPADYTGKLTHTYIDDEMKGTVIDYRGHVGSYDELSGIHLSKTDYMLSLSQLFIDYLKGVKYEAIQ